MGMTQEERATKNFISRLLAENGYPTYAGLFDEFDLNLTKDPGTIAFMEPSKGRIVVNRDLNADQVSTVIRHEILHHFLEHEKRLLTHLAKKKGLNFSDLDVAELANLKHDLYKNKKFNIAADYEISNRAYTDEDKRAIRNIDLGGKLLRGLVTEDDHPDWVDDTVEEMYDKLQETEEGDEPNNQPQDGDQEQSDGGKEGQSGSGSQGDQQSDDNSNGNSDSANSSNNSPDGQSSDGSSSDSSSSDDSNNSSKGSSATRGSGKNGRGSKEHAPEIGEKGNRAILDKEDAEREQQIDDEQASGNAAGGKESGEEKTARLERIKKILGDKTTYDKATGESSDAVNRSRAAKAARDAERYRNSPIKRFEDSLNRFIKNEVGNGRTQTWKKFNKTYANSGIIRPGYGTTRNAKIPLINVYFDRSGSWDEAKTQVGKDAIGTLNNYVRKGQIKINLYYFGNQVTSVDDSSHGYGTDGQPILDHIQDTRPDNVIIMTDSDIDDCRSNVTVPGAVWFLWKGGISHNLQEHLHGKSQTNNYEL